MATTSTNSTTQATKGPELIHRERENPNNIPAAVRDAVLSRDGEQCQLCGTGGDNRLQLHHLVYRSHGGEHVSENLVTLCFRCHEDVHMKRQTILMVELEEGVYAFFPGAPGLPTRGVTNR
jgi:5-methylcytosine-specific restriction endonuclease McrA